MTTTVLSAAGVTNRQVDSPRAFFDFLKSVNLMRAPRVALVGGLSFARTDIIAQALEQHVPAGAVVMTGDDRGADRIVARLASRAGHATAVFPAPWNRARHLRPNPAGKARNSLLLACNPAALIVFSADIAHDAPCRDIAEKAYHAGLTVTIVNTEPSSFTYRRQTPAVLTLGELKKQAEVVYGVLPR